MSSHFSNQTQSEFCRLPTEILLAIRKATEKYSDKVKLARTCRKLYYVLILDVYREAGKKLEWLPMFQAAEDGNRLTLGKCIKAGAPIDYQLSPYHPRPLVVAIRLSGSLALSPLSGFLTMGQIRMVRAIKVLLHRLLNTPCGPEFSPNIYLLDGNTKAKRLLPTNVISEIVAR